MPYKLKTPCNYPGCPAMAVRQGKCLEHLQKYEKVRGTSVQRGYNYRWRKYRLRFLAQFPLCEECRRAGKVTAATVVDHIDSHKGDYGKFWDERNHQALCKPCHDRKTAKEVFHKG